TCGAGADAAPLLTAFGIAERAVQDGNAIAEAAEKLPGHGGGEGDFGNEQEGAASGGERGFNGGEVYLGFARAGDAVEEERFEAARLDGGADAVEGGVLGGVKGVTD